MLICSVFILSVFLFYLLQIIINTIIARFGINTWYDFGPQFFKRGFIVMYEVGFLNCLWLFFFYPILLGLGYIIGDKIYNLF